MPHYMFLLYAHDDPGRSPSDRRAERRLIAEAIERLAERGLLVSADALHPVTTATTVRVRTGHVELDDGPFASTDEALNACFVVDCSDLDEALAEAVRLPTARYGSVEVRPVIDPRESWEPVVPQWHWPA